VSDAVQQIGAFDFHVQPPVDLPVLNGDHL
jgi:hypothetical protein